MATVYQLSHLIVWNWKKWMEELLRNIKFHFFQRAFIVEFENDKPTLHFKKNLMHQEWRELKSAPEYSLKLLVEAYAENDQPDVIIPQSLPDEKLEDLLVWLQYLLILKITGNLG
jgi:hypothetical protein